MTFKVRVQFNLGDLLKKVVTQGAYLLSAKYKSNFKWQK